MAERITETQLNRRLKDLCDALGKTFRSADMSRDDAIRSKAWFLDEYNGTWFINSFTDNGGETEPFEWIRLSKHSLYEAMRMTLRAIAIREQEISGIKTGSAWPEPLIRNIDKELLP